MSLERLWKDCTFVALDLETTGKYPLDAEICEIGAIKWQNGKIVSELQSLVRPSKPMSSEVIAIHGITNEMATSAPQLSEVLPLFTDFFHDSIFVAHNASFDMGFLAVELERAQRPLPLDIALCTSLLSRKLLPESPNHRLQTLVAHLNLTKGTAHRALDDARACLSVALSCFEKAGEMANLKEISDHQGGALRWEQFSIDFILSQPQWAPLLEAIHSHSELTIIYRGGSRPKEPRKIRPFGVVRNPRGDFVVAICGRDGTKKRFFLDKLEVQIQLSLLDGL